MKISVILLTYNSWDDTLDCLRSFSTQTTRHTLTVFVVDNGSKEKPNNPRGALKKAAGSLQVSYIELGENRGFSGGNNRGIKEALKKAADYILLLNNDTLVDAHLVDRLLAASTKVKNSALIGPKIYFAAGYEYHKKRYKKADRGSVIWYAGGNIDWNNVYASHRGVDEVDHGQYDTGGETDFVSGCCMLIPRGILEKIGFLDEKYFLYYEDADYCMRAKKAGYRVLYEPRATLWHKNAQSSGRAGSDTHVYYQTRNRMIFGIRYAPIRSKIALFRESFRLVLSGGVRKEAIVDYFTGRFGKRGMP